MQILFLAIKVQQHWDLFTNADCEVKINLWLQSNQKTQNTSQYLLKESACSQNFVKVFILDVFGV